MIRNTDPVVHHDFDNLYTSKMRSDDRIIKLSLMKGKLATTSSSSGSVDPRLFKGDNHLHAIKHPNTGLWYCKYEQGGIPEPLKVTFTTFEKLYEFVVLYYAKRNVEVVGVEDAVSNYL